MARYPLPDLPVTFRPRRARLVAFTLSVLVLAGCFGIALTVSGEGWSLPYRVAMAGTAVPIVAVLWLLARPRVDADAEGVTVVNLIYRHRLEWAQIVEVRLGVGDPWVQLDLDDGEFLPVMALQAADGERGRRMAAQLRALVFAQTRTTRND
jgi:Bacterial PH domain